MTTKDIGAGGADTPRFLDDDWQLELPIFVSRASRNELEHKGLAEETFDVGIDYAEKS